MTDLDSLRRAAIIEVALAIAVGIVTAPMYFAAFGFDLDAALFVRPEAVLGRGPATAVLWRWGFLGDMLLVLAAPASGAVPPSPAPGAAAVAGRPRPRRRVGIHLHRRRGGRGPGARRIVSYRGVRGGGPGGSGGDLRVVPPPARALVFGVWQTVDALTAGTWVMSTGWLALVERPTVGRLLVVLGTLGWALAVMTMSGIHSLAVLGGGFAAAMVAWIVWVIFERRRLARLLR